MNSKIEEALKKAIEKKRSNSNESEAKSLDEALLLARKKFLKKHPEAAKRAFGNQDADYIVYSDYSAEFARTTGARDKQPRKSRRDRYAQSLGESAIKGSMERARKGKYSPGILNKIKLGLSETIAQDKKGLEKSLTNRKKQMSNLEYNIAKRQAKMLNKGQPVADKMAAGVLYNRVKGKYEAYKL